MRRQQFLETGEWSYRWDVLRWNKEISEDLSMKMKYNENSQICGECELCS